MLDALAYGNDELLKSICAWGYPLGWISDADPRERMRARIWSENGGGVDDADDITVFDIHGEDNAIERVSFYGAFECKENGDDTLSETSVSTASPSERDVQREPLHRWATYPNTYFSSAFLSPYTLPPPPMPPPSWDDLSPEDTEEYLSQHIPRAPPPPAEAPPPLPPPPPDCPPPRIIFSPPLPCSPIASIPLPLLDRVDVNSESDMELSDSD